MDKGQTMFPHGLRFPTTLLGNLSVGVTGLMQLDKPIPLRKGGGVLVTHGTSSFTEHYPASRMKLLTSRYEIAGKYSVYEITGIVQRI
jgi:hypothetical protein